MAVIGRDGLTAFERRALAFGIAATTFAVAATRVATDPSWVRIWDNVHWTASYGAGTAVALSAWRRAAGKLALVRRGAAAGLSALFAGQLLWDIQVATGWNPFPGPSDAMFVLMGPCFGWGFLGLLHGRTRLQRLAVLLDALGLGLALLAVVLAWYLPKSGTVPDFTMAVLVAYPAGLLTVAALLFVAFLDLGEPPKRAALLLLGGVTAHGLLWMTWNAMTLEGTLGEALPINYAFSYATLLLGYGVAAFVPSQAPVTGSLARTYAIASRALPISFVVAAGAAVILGKQLAPMVELAVDVCTLGVVVVAAVRQTVVLEERSRLLEAENQNRELREQLVQSQKLEALGTLAGGIAHDFNNILVAILGNAELLRERVAGDPEAVESVEGVLKASDRARELVHRILAFSRREESKREPVALDRLSKEVAALLRAALPARHALVVEAEPGLPSVMASPAQFHQVLMNLGTNASHALGDRSGTVTFRARARVVAEGEATGLSPGRYLELDVTDDGCGMDEKVRRRVFEPFFTTKGNAGTGLGLSVVHGVVLDHGGSIEIESEPGKGTTIRLLLQASDMAAGAPSLAPVRREVHAVRRLEVLVVDDEIAIRRVLVRMLDSLGFTATAVSDPAKALELVREAPGRFALVVTDMSMPGMSGADLAEKLRDIRPELPVLLSSGTDFVLAGTPFAGVLPKPYTAATLKQALDPLTGSSPPS